MVSVYILQLKQGKYYVGKTTNLEKRLSKHKKGRATHWTKKYRFEKVVEIIPDCDEFEEDKMTLQYMKKYGIDNVRGGPFVQIRMNKHMKRVIQRMIGSNTDTCFECGSNEHFAKN